MLFSVIEKNFVSMIGGEQMNEYCLPLNSRSNSVEFLDDIQICKMKNSCLYSSI